MRSLQIERLVIEQLKFVTHLSFHCLLMLLDPLLKKHVGSLKVLDVLVLSLHDIYAVGMHFNVVLRHVNVEVLMLHLIESILDHSRSIELLFL